jgi:phage replication-related protein YjqB (UPF0714/DUF867 family)
VGTISRRNESESAHAVKFTPNKDKFSKPHSREHCSVNANQILMRGPNTRQQVRIERPTENGTTLALYTIENTHYEQPNEVFLDYVDLVDVGKRFGVPTEEPFQGKINPQVVAVGLSEYDAKVYSEFIEELTDDGYNRELVIIAPHGGDIEEHTDEQAEEVAKQLLPSKGVSVWMCKGFNKKEDGGAFARWHITSTDISEESFPKLKTISGRQFKYAIALHGWNGEKNSICIGGTIPYNLKLEIKRAIADAISGSGIVVAIGGDYSDDKRCPENFNGNNSDNIVNRLSPNGGVQIEQSKKAREKYGADIAKAIANVMRLKLTK